MARATIAAIAILGLTASLVSCAKDEGVQDNRTFAFADIEDFKPVDDRFTYSEPWSAVAGDTWAEVWPEVKTLVFEPADCMAFWTSSKGALASDASETASDEISHVTGALPGTVPDEGGNDIVSVTIRVFDSPGSASRFLTDVRASAVPCADGYAFNSEEQGYGYMTDSVSVSDVDLPGAGGVLKIDERDLTFEMVDASGSMSVFDHYTYYILVRGNVALVLIYGFDGNAVTDDDATDLIGQFIEHLG